MSHEITITLTDVEYKAMTVIAYSPQEWVQNVAKVRAKKAIISISDKLIADALAAGSSISGTREEMITNADLPTAKELTDAADAELAAT
jgi:hypothetical protein